MSKVMSKDIKNVIVRFLRNGSNGIFVLVVVFFFRQISSF